jgi:hypothetical protein
MGDVDLGMRCPSDGSNPRLDDWSCRKYGMENTEVGSERCWSWSSQEWEVDAGMENDSLERRMKDGTDLVERCDEIDHGVWGKTLVF